MPVGLRALWSSLLLSLCSTGAWSQSIETFYGIWIYADQVDTVSCEMASEGGEGPWIFIGKGFFGTNTSFCSETLMATHERGCASALAAVTTKWDMKT